MKYQALSIFLIYAAVSPLIQSRNLRSKDVSSNPIVSENKLPGCTLYNIPWSSKYKLGNDTYLQLQGFATQNEVYPGDSISFKVTVNPVQTFNVDIIRIGYYGGKGARLMKSIRRVIGVKQPPCHYDSETGLTSCDNWSNTFTLSVPSDWLSGIYLAVMTNEENYQYLMYFSVVDKIVKADVLFVSSINTHQAYNSWPQDQNPSEPNGSPMTGRSLYSYNSANFTPAVKVSFDRPAGEGGVLTWENKVVSLLEKQGYYVSYISDPTVDSDPSVLQKYKVVIYAGHPEYQTMNCFNGIVAARNKGVGIVFIAANELYWHVRYEPNSKGQSRRVMVGYKDTRPDPIGAVDMNMRTIRFRDIGMPEQLVVGIQYMPSFRQNWGGQQYFPVNTNHWAYKNTGMVSGVGYGVQATGYEVDTFNPILGLPENCTDYQFLASSAFVNVRDYTVRQYSSIYRSAGGNWVWATGSMNIAWTLSALSGYDPNTLNNTKIMTINIINRMLMDYPGTKKPTAKPADRKSDDKKSDDNKSDDRKLHRHIS